MLSAGVLLAMATVVIAGPPRCRARSVDFDRIQGGGLDRGARLSRHGGPGGARAPARAHYARAGVRLPLRDRLAGDDDCVLRRLRGAVVRLRGLKRTAREMSMDRGRRDRARAGRRADVRRWRDCCSTPSCRPAGALSLDRLCSSRHGDWSRLVTGHGVRDGEQGSSPAALPPQAPGRRCSRSGTNSASSGPGCGAPAFFAFRAIAKLPPRISPYLSASFACARARRTRANLDDWEWLMMLALALIACDVAARSQYRRRPRRPRQFLNGLRQGLEI